MPALFDLFRRPHRLPDSAPPPDRLDVSVQRTLMSAHGPLRLDISTTLARGECVALLGPSGAGKTTLLRLIAGLARAEGGHIHAFGQCWLDCDRGIDLPPRRRRAGFVFQDYALFPHMSARQQLRYALPPGRPAGRADDLLELVGLAALADARPARLSGGQQQRLALARALAAEPALLLLDEPLSALDGALRQQLQDELRALRQRLAPTLLIVTHDPGEALRLADRALLIEAGRVRADLPPAQLMGVMAKDGPVLSGRLVEQRLDTDGPARGRVLVEGQIHEMRLHGEGPWIEGATVFVSAEGWIASTPGDAVPGATPTAHS